MKYLSIILAVAGGACLAAAAWFPALGWPLVVTAVLLLIAAVFVASAVHARTQRQEAITAWRHAHSPSTPIGTPAIKIEPRTDVDAAKTALETEYQNIMRRDY